MTARIPGLRAAALIAATVLLVGIGSTASFAFWTGSAVKTASVTAASAAVAATGVSGLAATYDPGLVDSNSAVVTGSTSLIADTVLVTVANTGTTPLAYGITVTGGDATLNPLIALQVWKAASATCDASTPVAANATSGTFNAPPAMPSDAASATAGASLTLCMRTSISKANLTYPSATVLSTTPTLSVVGTVGSNWTAASSTSFTQTAAFSWYQVVRDSNDKCLGSNNNSAAPGATLTLTTCKTAAATNNQSFRFAPVQGETSKYRIYIGVGTTAGPVLSGNNSLSGGAVTLASVNASSNNQIWSILPQGNTGSYRIVLKSTVPIFGTVLCLTSSAAEASAFTVTQCGPDNSTSASAGSTYANQHFTFTEVP